MRLDTNNMLNKVRAHIKFFFREQLCKLRHDFQFSAIVEDEFVELQCFYCGKTKIQYICKEE